MKSCYWTGLSFLTTTIHHGQFKVQDMHIHKSTKSSQIRLKREKIKSDAYCNEGTANERNLMLRIANMYS